MSLSACAADRLLRLHAAHGGVLTRQSSMGQALSGFMRTGLQQPMSRAMTAVSEGSMAALQAPVTLALASARMGSGVIMVGSRLKSQHMADWVCSTTMVDHHQQQLHAPFMSLTTWVSQGAMKLPKHSRLLPAKHMLIASCAFAWFCRGLTASQALILCLMCTCA